MGSLGSIVVKKIFPPQTSRLQRERQEMLNAPLFGSPDNHSFSTIQVNISPLTTMNLSGLGYGGRSHTDRHDDPMSLTILICISKLEDTTDPGQFYIGETREWCTLYPFSMLIFRGTGPHGGTQAIAHGHPKEWEKRINLILYPRGEFVNRELPVQYPCYEKTRLSDYSFFQDGEACFGTSDYHKRWEKIELVLHLADLAKVIDLGLKPSELQAMYRVVAGPNKTYIDQASVEGMRRTDEVAAANTIMRDVRPQWKDAANQRGRKAKRSATEPETRVIETPVPSASSPKKAIQSSTSQLRPTHAVPMLVSNAGTIAPTVVSQSKTIRSTSKTTVALPILTIPPAMSQRTTWNRSNTTVTVPVMLGSEISGGPSTITAAIVPSTSSSRITRRTAPKPPQAPSVTRSSSGISAITRSATDPVAVNSRTTRSQKKQPTLKVVVEIDDNLDQGQAMENATNHSSTAEDSDNGEINTEDSESDDSDDGHLTDNDTPWVAESNSNEIALDIIHNTILDNSVVEPACRSDLASILQKTSLFNESELRRQQDDLISEGILLRQQYRSRMPSAQNVLPHPSSLKLPETNGPIIVEQLMQLGERCQWITQKHEAMKGYLRALDEHLLLTMLGVEKLFDSRYLRQLFKGRRSGAGICTKRLMDKVETMVRKSMDKLKPGHTRDETFQFNVKEILGSQYQPKFCISVEVTIKSYNGKNEYHHMAQHFREVRNLSH
jgi:hypothetical protein